MDRNEERKIDTTIEQCATRESIGRDLRGWDFLEDGWVNCGSCNKRLMNYIKVQDTPKISKIQCVCPYCKSKSFKIKLTGEFIANPSDDLVIIDMQLLDFDAGTYYTETLVELEKCK